MSNEEKLCLDDFAHIISKSPDFFKYVLFSICQLLRGVYKFTFVLSFRTFRVRI